MVNNRQLAQVGLGLIGVWALMYALVGFIQVIGLAAGGLVPMVLAEILPELLTLGASYVLVFHNDRVIRAIFPAIDDVGEALPPDFATTLIVIVGVFLLVETAPAVITTVLSLASAEASDRAQLLRRLVSVGVEAGIALYLITRPGRLLGYLQRPAPEPAS